MGCDRVSTHVLAVGENTEKKSRTNVNNILYSYTLILIIPEPLTQMNQMEA